MGGIALLPLTSSPTPNSPCLEVLVTEEVLPLRGIRKNPMFKPAFLFVGPSSCTYNLHPHMGIVL